jgi:hypothetical protein
MIYVKAWAKRPTRILAIILYITLQQEIGLKSFIDETLANLGTKAITSD